MMKKLIALLMAAACAAGSALNCFAAEAAAAPVQEPAAVAASGEIQNRLYTYSTAEKDTFNFANVNFFGAAILVKRRGYQDSTVPDQISVKSGVNAVLEQDVEWEEGAVQGAYFGYDYYLDLAALDDGNYTLVIDSTASTVVEGNAGNSYRYLSPYTLATIRFVKRGGECYIPESYNISSRYNYSLLQQLQAGKAPDDFAELKEYYDGEENSRVLGQIEAKSKELTAGMYSDLDKCLAIYQWVVDNIAYDHDFPRENVEAWLEVNPEESPRLDDPLNAFDKGYAMCYGYAKLTTLMLGYAGVDCVYVKGCYDADNVSGTLTGVKIPEEYNHAWNAVNISGSWYFIDTCMDTVRGYYRTDANNPASGYTELNKLPSYVHVFPTLKQISNTHIALRYGAKEYGKKLNDIEAPSGWQSAF